MQSEYKNATLHEEKIGMNKTLTLKSLIDRHILRRTVDTADVHLPEKHEEILFCSLTDEQKDLYEGFLTVNLQYFLNMRRKNLVCVKVILLNF